METNHKIVTMDDLVLIRRELNLSKKIVVWTNGCYDLLHIGHVRGMLFARQKGDTLIVGINDDESVSILKGPGRPFICASDRAEMVAALACVDYVTIFSDLTPQHILHTLQPDIFCKGAEFLRDPTNAFIAESEIVQAYGGSVELLPMLPGISTSLIIKKIVTAQAEREPEGGYFRRC